MSEKVSLQFQEDGPIILTGEVEVTNSDGTVTDIQKSTAFCRCGLSENKPFCDGHHVASGFTAAEGLGIKEI